MVAVRLKDRQRVELVATILLPMSAGMVWGQMRSFAYFVGLDPFHAGIRAADESVRLGAGAAIVLGHRFGPIRFDRVGRVLKWREGTGYSFSDLSRGGNGVGFPHIFTYEVKPKVNGDCRLTIAVRGRWTATMLPAWMIRRWLRWTMGHTLHSIHNQLMVIEIHRRASRNKDWIDHGD